MPYICSSYGQPLYYYLERWIGGEWSLIYQESSGATITKRILPLKELNNITAEIGIYPVAAHNKVSIAIAWRQPQAFGITLMDMPAGNSMISIESAAGKTTRTITAIR